MRDKTVKYCKLVVMRPLPLPTEYLKLLASNG